RAADAGRAVRVPPHPGVSMPLRRITPAVHPHLAAAAALVSLAALAVIDLVTPFNYVISILYCVPLSFAAITRNRRFLIALAVATEVLTFIPYYLGPAVSVPGVEPIALTNHGLTAVMLLTVTAALL